VIAFDFLNVSRPRRDYAVNAKTPVGTKSTSAPEPADELASGNIDKVRDILFGGQMRDYERRFASLEDRLLKETSDMKEDVRKRLSALETFVRQETESLAERITTEHNERADATKDLARDAGEHVKAFEKKTGQLDDQIGRAQRELRQQLLDIQQTMSDDLRKTVDDVMARIARESGELRHEKTDRATLAALLTEMAMRLTNELSIAGLDKERNG
jgi:seryl-tRNA synthetase